MNRLKQRIKRLEERVPPRPCKHPLPGLVFPTDEEIQEMEAILDQCPRCSKLTGPKPRMLIIRGPQDEREEGE